MPAPGIPWIMEQMQKRILIVAGWEVVQSIIFSGEEIWYRPWIEDEALSMEDAWAIQDSRYTSAVYE